MTPGATLRESYNSPQPANTDFIHTTGNPKLGGLCLSCHNNYLGTKTVGAPTKGTINDRNALDSEEYYKSGHNYTVPVTRIATSDTESSSLTKTFDANCTKCHNSSDAIFQPLENASQLQLFAHYVPGGRLLARFGIVANIAKPSTNTDLAVKKQEDFNNNGMCFGCHSRKGEIAGNAGKQYAGKDWYGKQTMRSAYSTTWKNASDTVMGTQNFNSEAVFDDMYITKDANGITQAFQSGDGAGGPVDLNAKSVLVAKHELSGHQKSLDLDINKQTGDGSSPDKFSLRGYVRKNMTSIRCSDCHNVHSSSKGSMGTYTDWPTTAKPKASTDLTTPAGAVAKDGTRLITLNDYWARDNITRWNFQPKIENWLRDYKGVSDPAERTRRFEKMEYDGITSDLMRQVNTDTPGRDPFSVTDISDWEKTVDIFCFRCHAFAGMDDNVHKSKFGSHQKKALACVECHVPQVHGSKMDFLLADRGSIPGIDGRASGVVAPGHNTMQPQQIFKWANFDHNLPSAQSVPAGNLNQPATKLLRYVTADIGKEAWIPQKSSCSTTPECHGAAAVDTIAPGWSHWVNKD